MKKLHITLLVVLSLAVGGVAGGYTVYSLQSSGRSAAGDSVTTGQNQVAPKSTMSGFGLTPTQMVDELSAIESSEEFDWRYVNYLQTLRLNEAAMSKLAADKSIKPELQAMAREQAQLSLDLNDQLTTWRGVWGFTDH